TAVSFDQPTYFRSLSTENSPYYVSGAKASYQTRDGIATFALYALNGWQNIARDAHFPAGGTQIVVKLESFTFNWSTYVGDERKDKNEARQIRFFNDVWFKYAPSDKFYLLGLFDVGTQRRQTVNHSWWTFNAIGWMKLSRRWGAALRGEAFTDPTGVAPLEAFDPRARFQLVGASVNFDFRPDENVLMRLETRLLEGYWPYETNRKTTVRIAASIAVSI
ncbi:MAG: porin, partial [Bacteroidia bacterium]|nr:porin [Bacteroidia bacterium]